MDNKGTIDIILASIRIEMETVIYKVCDTYVRKRIVDAYELGKSTGAVEALEEIKKKVDGI
jgi:hypothetical protein